MKEVFWNLPGSPTEYFCFHVTGQNSVVQALELQSLSWLTGALNEIGVLLPREKGEREFE